MKELDPEDLEKVLDPIFKELGITGAFIAYYRRQFEDKENIWLTANMKNRPYEYGFMEYGAEEITPPTENLDEQTLNKSYDYYASSDELIRASVMAFVELGKKSQYFRNKVLELLGINTSRMIPLEENEIYVVFTETAIYHISHNQGLWTLTQVEGSPETIPPDFIDEVFIGNVQDDGTVFRSGNLPIISTGDKMLFGLSVDNEGIFPNFMSPRVRNVVPLKSLN